MNENLDLTKILDGCPKGTKFYSSFYGEVSFERIDGGTYPVIFVTKRNTCISVTQGGKHIEIFDGECTVFPSKEQRDWSKFERFWDKPKAEEPTVEMFDKNTLKPFDKVLVRDFLSDNWMTDFFEKIEKNDIHYNVTCLTCKWIQCIPYNEETKHLVGTKEDCPEYYKWWEEEQ